MWGSSSSSKWCLQSNEAEQTTMAVSLLARSTQTKSGNVADRIWVACAKHCRAAQRLGPKTAEVAKRLKFKTEVSA